MISKFSNPAFREKKIWWQHFILKTAQKNSPLFFVIIAIVLSQYFVFPPEANSAIGVPKIISYQGRLANSSGSLLGGSSGTTFYFKFSIHSAASGGAQIWPLSNATPCTHSLVVTDGVFNANIGDTAECSDVLDIDFNANDTLYLQVQVSSNNSSFETLAPRQRITSSGFAINAGTVSGSTGAPNVLGTLVTYQGIQAGAALTSGTVFSIDTLSSFTGNLVNVQFASSTRFLIDQGGVRHLAHQRSLTALCLRLPQHRLLLFL